MLQTIGNFLFKYRTIVFPAFLPLALLPSPTLFDHPLYAAVIGFALSALGEAVRVTTIGMQYIVRGGRDRRVYAKDLVTGGFYAHTRNPMYVGNVLILVGLAVASNSWFCAVVLTAAYVFVCVAIVAAEESYLRDKFGAAFDEYCRDVPRWLPRMSGIGATLADYQGLVACGGFSYGDTLGAGEVWARSILFNALLAEQFAAFFGRPDTLALGVCNGCQMMAALAAMIPGAQAWPKFTRNKSEQFEARLSLVEVLASPSLFFTGMAGSRLPIAVAHGEGYADFSQRGDAQRVQRAMRFVDHHGQPTETYPHNPNGSPEGLTAVTTPDGRFTVLMPHPERVFRNVQMSWNGGDVSAPSPWMRLFHNARAALR